MHSPSDPVAGPMPDIQGRDLAGCFARWKIGSHPPPDPGRRSFRSHARPTTIGFGWSRDATDRSYTDRPYASPMTTDCWSRDATDKQRRNARRLRKEKFARLGVKASAKRETVSGSWPRLSFLYVENCYLGRWCGNLIFYGFASAQCHVDYVGLLGLVKGFYNFCH